MAGTEFTDLQMDALREIGNIGSGNAATALSDLLARRVDITVPNVRLIPTTEIPEMVGGADREVVGVYFGVEGGMEGAAMHVFPVEEARLLADTLLGLAPGTTREIGEMELSVAGEVGNILTGSYMTAMQGFTGIEASITPPSAVCSTALVVLNECSVIASASADYTIWVETDFILEGGNFAAYLILLVTPESMERVLTALGVG